MRRILPPVLFLLLLFPLVGLALWHPPGGEIRTDRPTPWDVPLILGILLLAGARWQFAKARAEIHTFRPPTTLVTSGIYRFMRNPMYVGFALLLLGGALYVNTVCALLVPFAFLLAARVWYIPAEERAAREAFGPACDAYAARVGRWM